jgi:hypothetical protein
MRKGHAKCEPTHMKERFAFWPLAIGSLVDE